MAQALFDHHPLEEYLRSAGEAPEFIPGSSADFELELEPLHYIEYYDGGDLEEFEWRPLILIKLTEMMFIAMMATLNTSNNPSPFAERFKYDVISSSLLAASLPSAHGRPTRPTLPGHLNHSRTPSAEIQPATLPHAPSSDCSYLKLSLSVLVVVFLTGGYTLFFSIASIGAIVYIFRTTGDTSKRDISPVLESLNDLIASSNEWETVVQETISTLEHDELTTSHTSPPFPPSSPLRVALQSSLHTTQTQCDNIRQLFSALTLPSELAQLSEMYAPPSPMKSAFSPHETSRRPLSLPARRRTLSMPLESLLGPQDQRSTWGGSHNMLDSTVSSTKLLKRREKRRSDLSSILSGSPPLAVASAPVSPLRASPFTSPNQGLSLVNEEDDPEHDQTNAGGYHPFGAAALELHRSRKSAGMEAFKSPPPSYFSDLPPPTHTIPSTLSFGSKYTPIQPPRHQFSLIALNQAVQGAMASKRYACSHLLALRFAEQEDEGYWEDVRSVMGLLASTLVDASSRLAEALKDAEREQSRYQNLTPSLVTSFHHGSDDEEKGSNTRLKEDRRRSSDVSFAPLPSHLSRFAAHVETITTALDDAREYLQECVASLREEPDNTTIWSNRKHRSRPPHASTADAKEEPHVLQVYERLRRELGLALRECERGKERLYDIVYPLELCDEDEDSVNELPGLGHDASDDSDKPDLSFPFDEEVEQEQAGGYTVVTLAGVEGVMDDATSHLLFTASTQHLPPPGIEQVFEADTGGPAPPLREKSKLSREERIKLMKARRQSGGSALGGVVDLTVAPEKGGVGGGGASGGVEKWGPGGEVVQELKDVIWKVRERRRKMAGGPPPDPSRSPLH